MNGGVKSSVLGALCITFAGWCCFACNDRFEFDVAGAAGNPTAGATVAGGGGGAGVGGASAGGASGSASGSAGEACGVGPACPAGLHCVDGACHQCASDADCPTADAARCDPARHRCVGCLVAGDCPSDFGCDPLANRCLRTCSADLPCPEAAHGCNEERMVCYACDEDRECEQSPLGAFCALDGSGCVQCRGDLGCEASQHCDELTGRCVECRDGDDCVSRLCEPQLHSCLPS